MSIFGTSGSLPDETKNLPVLDGTFTITTDGAILANNTDEGPLATTAGKQLSWKVTRRTNAAPMAMIQLGN